MTVSRLYMPAVTLAGALALAGCGGGGGAGLSPAEIAANQAADAAVTATNGAVDAAFALDLTADDAGDKVSAAAGLITAARTAVGRLTGGQSDQADGLTARLNQANKFVTLAGQLLAEQKKARDDAMEAATKLSDAMKAAEMAAEVARQAAIDAAKAAEEAQETAVSDAEAAVRKEAAEAAMKAKEAADKLLAAETAKVTAAQNDLNTANGRITTLEGEIRTLEGRIRTAENEKTEAENAERTAEARTEAAALYKALADDLASHRGSMADFTAAKGEKHHQKIMVEGEPFDMVADGDGTADASNGIPKGAYELVGTNSVEENKLDIADAKASAFSPGPTVKTHDKGDTGIFTTSGEWRGVSGTFYCNGATCTSRNGAPTGSGWSFKPGNVKDRVTEKDATWGWWVVPAEGTTDPMMVKVFTDPGGLAATTAAPTENGSATYEGDATGKYAVPGEAGHFTAKAHLTAKFGTDADMLSGEIRDFKDADGRDKAGWSVSLEENDLDNDGGGLAAYAEDTTGKKLKTVWTRDGRKGDAMEEAWTAELHGGDADKVSTHILGTFKAQHQGSRMVGAFGAENE